MKLLNELSNWYFSRKALPYWCVLLVDCVVVAISGYVSFYITHSGDVFASSFWPLTRGLLLLILIFILPFRLFHTYSGILRYSSFVDLQRLSMAILIGSAATCAVNLLFGDLLSGIGILLLDWKSLTVLFCIVSLALWLERVLVKTVFDVFRQNAATQPVFIYGVREGGVAIAKSIRNDATVKYSLKGFVSPDDSMKDAYLLGVPVYQDDEKLVEIMKEKGVKAFFVSPLQTVHFREREDLVNALIDAGIHILMYPEAEEWDGHTIMRRLKEVDIEDVLPRNKIEVDLEAIGLLLKGKTILITGAAGSIGSEMVRQVALFQPKAMILIDQAETPMHDIRRMMAGSFPDVEAVTLVSSITKKERMESLFQKYRPDYVFHAAAYKHVPMMEDNPVEAIQNNVYGTRVIADLAVRYGTRKFVMISTDKAVNPTNVMGCSKRICEIYCQSLNAAIAAGKVECVTQFVTTIFGNVLGSNGSVIPIFREQIAKGGPVTVTHPDIVRFFMLIPEACRLVLEAGTMGRGGEIFVFDMGKPVRIVDLAKRMISLSGATDVQIVFSGLRDGEKLYEEVLSDAEKTAPTCHPKIKVAKVREYEYAEACANEERLFEACRTFDDMAIVKVMKEIVPEFKSKNSKYEILDINEDVDE